MDTHISLSPDLKAKIEREAAARGISLADFVLDEIKSAFSFDRHFRIAGFDVEP